MCAHRSFNPGALTFSALTTSWRDWRMWIDSQCHVQLADGNWTKYHRKRMESARAVSPTAKLVLAVQASLPRLVLVVGCTAYLRASRTLAKVDPWWAVHLLFVGALELGGLALAAMAIASSLASARVERLVFTPLFGKGSSSLRFAVTQLIRVTLVLAWFVINWSAWESWCWQLSCTRAEAALRDCRFDPLAVTGSVSGYACTPRNLTGLDSVEWVDDGLTLLGREPDHVRVQPARACPRVCTGSAVVLGSVADRCVNWPALEGCVAAASPAGQPGLGHTYPSGPLYVLAFLRGSAGDEGNAVAACLNGSMADALGDPVVEDYPFCMGETPTLGVLFLGSLLMVVMVVQWLGLVDHEGWSRWSDAADKAHQQREMENEQVFGYLLSQEGRTASLARLVEGMDLPNEVITRALEDLSAPTPWRAVQRRPPHGHADDDSVLFCVSIGAGNRGSRAAIQPVCERLRQAWHTIWAMPRRLLVAAATVAGAIADFHYRLFDIFVALVLFTLLTLLTLLPLHSAQSMLLFNANFWKVIQRSVRITDFLEELYN